MADDLQGPEGPGWLAKKTAQLLGNKAALLSWHTSLLTHICAWLQHKRRLYAEDGEAIRELAVPDSWPASDKDQVAWLAKETVEALHSVLIFCNSRVVRSAWPCVTCTEGEQLSKSNAESWLIV